MKALAMFLAAALLSPSLLLAQDTDYPLVTSISISPASVDITENSQSITLTVDITDDESGFDFGNLNLFNEAGQRVSGAYFDEAQRTAGTELAGTYVCQVPIPQYASPGTWRAEVLMLDNAGNIRVFGPQTWHSPFPVPEDSEFTVVNDGEVDSTPPEISNVTVTPEVVNTANGDTDMTISVSTADLLSGFSAGFIHLIGPDQGDIFGYFSEFNLQSGTVNDGVFVTTVTLPEGSETGEWSVLVEVVDLVGNQTFSSDAVFTVGSTAPTSSFLAQATDALDLPWYSSGSGWVYQTDNTVDGIDAAMTRPTPDDGECVMQTKVTGPGTLYFDWSVDSEEFADVLSVEVIDGDQQEISGSTGWISASLDIPAGEQTVIWRYTKDGGNSSGEDKGWVDRVHFESSNEDLSLPKLQGLHFSNRAPNVSEDEAFIDFTIEVSDDYNGFSEGRIELYDAGGSPRVSTSFDIGNRISGDQWFGTYQISLPVGTDWPAGKSRVRIELTEETTNETRTYAPSEEPFPIADMDAFHVIKGSPDDTEAPKLRELEITPRTVDVSNGPATVTVTLRATDNGRGFADGNVTLLTPQDGYVSSYSLYGDGGREYDGIHQVEVEIPQYAVSGRWSLSSYLRDLFSNEREYPWTEPFPSGVNPSFTVVNSGIEDETAPSVTAFSITPNQVDTTTAGVPVEVTITLTDDIAGVRDAYIFFYDSAGIYQSDLFAVLNDDNQISSSGLTRTHKVTRTIPQGSIEGTWRVDVFLRDHAGNSRNYGPNDTLPGSGTFIVGDGATPSLFEAFLSTYSLTGNDALPNADPDGDGLNNVTELMLGSNPTSTAGSVYAAFSLSKDASNLRYDFTIDPTLNVSVNGLFLELRNGSGGAPLRVTGQMQTGLAGIWSNLLPVHQTGSTWRISVPLSGSNRRFMRLFFEDP